MREVKLHKVMSVLEVREIASMVCGHLKSMMWHHCHKRRQWIKRARLVCPAWKAALEFKPPVRFLVGRRYTAWHPYEDDIVLHVTKRVVECSAETRRTWVHTVYLKRGTNSEYFSRTNNRRAVLTHFNGRTMQLTEALEIKSTIDPHVSAIQLI